MIVTGEQVLVKRVIRTSGAEWKLVSDNPQYGPVNVSIEGLKQVWTVRRHIRSKLPPPA